jgi:glycosyltransferase involved in cell wall biosynthesis
MQHARPLHVGINAHLLSRAAGYRSAGVSTYSRHLLTALGQMANRPEAELRVTAYLHVPDFAPPGITPHLGTARLEVPALRIGWEQTVLPWRLAQDCVDLVHGLVNVLPLATRRPGVVTVHDLTFMRFPELFKPTKRLYLTALCRASVARAAQVVAVSRQTAADLAHFWQVDDAKVLVAPNGVDARFTPGTHDETVRFRQAQGLPARYWLYVGTLEPRKNLTRLLEAFARWRAQAPEADQAVRLVLAGGKGWYYEAIFAQVQMLGLTEVVSLPGFIPDEALPDWYRAAELFLYPSRYEGFGLPVVEAMACGTPVLCSDAPGVAEVAGAAAWLVPVDDVSAWVAALHTLAQAEAQRDHLRVAGLARAAQFTWANAAAITCDAYRRAAQHSA